MRRSGSWQMWEPLRQHGRRAHKPAARRRCRTRVNQHLRKRAQSVTRRESDAEGTVTRQHRREKGGSTKPARAARRKTRSLACTWLSRAARGAHLLCACALQPNAGRPSAHVRPPAVVARPASARTCGVSGCLRAACSAESRGGTASSFISAPRAGSKPSPATVACTLRARLRVSGGRARAAPPGRTVLESRRVCAYRTAYGAAAAAVG